MNEYYAVVRTGDSLSHYGIKGMRWGIRRNPEHHSQKVFYKEMKRTMKAATKANRKAKSYQVSGVKQIGDKLPREMVNQFKKANDRFGRAYNALEAFDDKIRKGKMPSHAQAIKNGQTIMRLAAKSDRLYDQYETLRKKQTQKLLGKYANRKMRAGSPWSIDKRSADYLLEAAFRSQLKPRKRRI